MSIQNLPDSEVVPVAEQTFVAYNANPGNYPGVPQQLVDDLKVDYQAFDVKLTKHVGSQAQARADRLDKDAGRIPVEAKLAMIKALAKAGGATESAISAMGIPSASGKAPANATVPAGSVDTSQRLRHTISWTDAATPENKRRPRGVMGCEIFVKLDGPPPVDEKECTYLALDSKTPYVAEYPGTDAGKMAHYLVRWRMADGTVTAFGETISATITG